VVDPAARALELSDAGERPTAEALGGVDAVLSALPQSASSRAAPVLATVIAETWGSVDHAEAREVLVATLRAETDPLGYEDLLSVFFAHPSILEVAASQVEDDALARFRERVSERDAGMAAIAVDALLRLVLTHAITPWKFYAALEEVAPDDPPHLLIDVIRRLGALYAHETSDPVRSLVRGRLTTLAGNAEVRSDCAFELARVDLIDALEASSPEDAERLLRTARKGFAQAHELDVGRDDAQLHLAALDAVLGLVDGEDQAALETSARQIHELALVRKAWRAPGRLSWLGDPLEADLEWWTLSRAFAYAAHAARPDVWLHPTVMLEQLALALQATTTARLLPDVEALGLRATVVPVLRAAFLHDASRREVLRAWVRQLAEDEWTAGERLLREVESADPKVEADRLREELIRELDGDEVTADSLSRDGQLRLLRRLDAWHKHLEPEKTQIRRLLADVRSQLGGNPDYAGEIRVCFDRVLVDSIRFLDDRMNVILAGERFAYLRKPDALEGALQEDYRQWMVGNGLQGLADIEVSGVSGGRVDVRFSFGPNRLVTEVKRDPAPFDERALDKYLNQAGMYQASNVRLGILLVLDLSDKSRGEMRSLENSVWVTTKPAIAEGDLERHIVVVVVPGNRPLTPSQVRA
jgi:hypothetical protein